MTGTDRTAAVSAPSRRALRGVALFAIAASLAGAGLWAHAQQPAAPRTAVAPANPSWGQLNPAQRSALAPLERDWAHIEPDRKAKWLEIASRFPVMSADERQRVQARMSDWARMTPAERGRARLSFQEAKQLPASERQARWEAYQALPAEQRQALATRATPVRPDAGASAAASGKRNIVGNPSLAAQPAKPVAPTVVQANPGATTTLVTEKARPPLHQQTGLPKIVATPAFVDRTTLLPKRGPQGAATARVAASGTAPSPAR